VSHFTYYYSPISAHFSMNRDIKSNDLQALTAGSDPKIQTDFANKNCQMIIKICRKFVGEFADARSTNKQAKQRAATLTESILPAAEKVYEKNIQVLEEQEVELHDLSENLETTQTKCTKFEANLVDTQRSLTENKTQVRAKTVENNILKEKLGHTEDVMITTKMELATAEEKIRQYSAGLDIFTIRWLFFLKKEFFHLSFLYCFNPVFLCRSKHQTNRT